MVAADKGTATFSDIANADLRRPRLLARRRLRVRRLGRLRPQEDGHHRARRLGIGQAPLPRDRRRHRQDAVHRGRRRRHVGRRVRQRLAARSRRPSWSPPSIIATSSSTPTPDPEKSFAERKRLFDLPRSSWQDYDKALISKGGGVFSRSLKEITLSPEAQAALGFDKAKATPQEVMNAILKAPVDLLFFGGIGTYVRASSETDEAVGDRANDAIRVTGADIRAKVIGEGANLGMTQRGRIEAALRGVRLNTDAIDNSAGVNTSDIEVNIKIALARPVSDGRLTPKARGEPAGGDDRGCRRAGAAQQLSADAVALAGRAARAGRPRLPAAPDADAGGRGRARPRGRISARRQGDRRAPPPFAAADAAGAFGAARLRQALAAGASPGIDGAGRSLSRARAHPLFPDGDRRAIPRRARASSAAPRDHRDAARQLDDQPRRAVVRGAHRRRRPAPRRRRSSPPSPRCATATA